MASDRGERSASTSLDGPITEATKAAVAAGDAEKHLRVLLAYRTDDMRREHDRYLKDCDLRAREIALREHEIALRDRELDLKARESDRRDQEHRRRFWFDVAKLVLWCAVATILALSGAFTERISPTVLAGGAGTMAVLQLALFVRRILARRRESSSDRRIQAEAIARFAPTIRDTASASPTVTSNSTNSRDNAGLSLATNAASANALADHRLESSAAAPRFN